jgi:hypothetical protein
MSHVWLEGTVPAPHPFPHQQFENLVKKKKYIEQYSSAPFSPKAETLVDRSESMLLFAVARLPGTCTWKGITLEKKNHLRYSFRQELPHQYRYE